MNSIRVRFAPSPTGPLHIGGVRTALFNYLFAKSKEGAFILRVEDTDQKRFVSGAEEYISKALNWLGISPDESPKSGGEFGPYRQSERRQYYQNHMKRLVESGAAYYAFDSAEEIEAMRLKLSSEGIHSPKYDHDTRKTMRNSLTLSQEEADELLAGEIDYTIRLKVEPEQQIQFIDKIRGEVTFSSSELDDKVLLKSDGLPTYHFANVVDDYEMKITHVIRGDEWLSSTPHHVLLYQALGWKDDMPTFVHLPLILNPSGKGKLSKRDGQRFGIPVFPLEWETGEETFAGFKDLGFLPEATINFLALLGWNSGTEQELFTMDQLIELFSFDKVNKSGARFDFDKAKWFNQQYILNSTDEYLENYLSGELELRGISKDAQFIHGYVDLFKSRIETLNELVTAGAYFFEDIEYANEKLIRKKWKDVGKATFLMIAEKLNQQVDWQATQIKTVVEESISENNSSFGGVLPLLRIAMTGDVKGPDIFATMELLGKELGLLRMSQAPERFNLCL